MDKVWKLAEWLDDHELHGEFIVMFVMAAVGTGAVILTLWAMSA
jgi:hypothetical protein